MMETTTTPSREEYELMEQIVLGTMLLDFRAATKIIEILPGPAVFNDQRHRELYLLLCRCKKDGEAVHSIANDEETRNYVGGIPYVRHLVNSVPSAETGIKAASELLEVFKKKYLGRALPGLLDDVRINLTD